MASIYRSRSAVLQNRAPVSLKLLFVYLTAITIFGKGPTYLNMHLISRSFPLVYWDEIVILLQEEAN